MSAEKRAQLAAYEERAALARKVIHREMDRRIANARAKIQRGGEAHSFAVDLKVLELMTPPEMTIDEAACATYVMPRDVWVSLLRLL